MDRRHRWATQANEYTKPVDALNIASLAPRERAQ
jgi:hypothetical protein